MSQTPRAPLCHSRQHLQGLRYGYKDAPLYSRRKLHNGSAGHDFGRSQYGIRIGDDTSPQSIIGGNYVEGWYGNASVFLAGAAANRNPIVLVANYAATNTNSAATNGTWKSPTKPTTEMSLENNVAVTYLFANLPPNTVVSTNQDNRVEGETYNITNCSTSTFGAAAAAGGSTHAKVRVNSANTFIVIGK